MSVVAWPAVNRVVAVITGSSGSSVSRATTFPEKLWKDRMSSQLKDARVGIGDCRQDLLSAAGPPFPALGNGFHVFIGIQPAGFLRLEKEQVQPFCLRHFRARPDPDRSPDAVARRSIREEAGRRDLRKQQDRTYRTYGLKQRIFIAGQVKPAFSSRMDGGVEHGSARLWSAAKLRFSRRLPAGWTGRNVNFFCFFPFFTFEWVFLQEII